MRETLVEIQSFVENPSKRKFDRKLVSLIYPLVDGWVYENAKQSA